MLTPKRQGPMLIRLIVAGILLSSIGLTSHLFDHYQRTCPKELDEQDGFIYPLNNHGSVVYLNLAEHRTMQAAWAYLGGSVLGIFAFGIWLSCEPKVKA
jgi:hypothetical protein